MSKWIREHFKSLFYNPHRCQARSGRRFPKAIERYIDLLKKQEKEGETLWIKKTMPKSLLRLKKYGITRSMIEKTLSDKWLTNLTSLVTIK